MTAAHAGLKMFVSLPHFYGSPQLAYGGDVLGLSPEKELHDFTISVEPFTGKVIESHIRWQINFEVGPTDFFYPRLMDAHVPLVWYERGEHWSKQELNDFRGRMEEMDNALESALAMIIC